MLRWVGGAGLLSTTCTALRSERCEAHAGAGGMRGWQVDHDLLVITDPNVEHSADQETLVLSARVHPGETNSSYNMRGLIQFLTSMSDGAQMLRKHYQIIVVPMLNPDGVMLGNYR